MGDKVEYQKKRSLREAFEYRGCPICYILGRVEFDFMATLQYQIAREEKMRQGVVSAHGYCNFHFYEMARLASPMGMAILTKDLIHADIKERERNSLKSPLRVNCLICRNVDEWEEFYAKEFRAFLSEESFRKEYEGTDGLCRIHLERILSSLHEDGLRQFVLATHEMHLRLLETQLETFISKMVSTRRDFQEEKDSWQVAIEKIAGKRGLKG